MRRASRLIEWLLVCDKLIKEAKWFSSNRLHLLPQTLLLKALLLTLLISCITAQPCCAGGTGDHIVVGLSLGPALGDPLRRGVIR
jgi:hypothetical protein